MSKFFNAPQKKPVYPPDKGPLSMAPAPQAKRPRICVLCPCHDNRMHSMFAMSVFNLVASNKFELGFLKVSSGGITKARNDLAHLFLKTGWEYALWLDTDIQFGVHHLEKLLARDQAIIGGMYAHKKADLGWSAHNKAGGGVPVDDLQEVAALGMGFMLHKREVYQNMIDSPELELDFIETWNEETGKKKYGFYQERIVMDAAYGFPYRTWLTEDWFFSYNARKLGYKIYTDNSFYLNHWDGGQCFPMEPIMDTSTTLIQYMQGLQDGGKLAGEVMGKRFPGYLDQFNVSHGRTPADLHPQATKERPETKPR